MGPLQLPRKVENRSLTAIYSWFIENTGQEVTPTLLATGFLHCELLSSIFPQAISLKSARKGDSSLDSLHNWKLIQRTFVRLGTRIDFSISRLSIPCTQELLTFNRWFIHLIELNRKEAEEDKENVGESQKNRTFTVKESQKSPERPQTDLEQFVVVGPLVTPRSKARVTKMRMRRTESPGEPPRTPIFWQLP